MTPGDIVKTAFSRAGVIRVRNALNPMLWLSLTCLLISPGFAYLFRDDALLKYGFSVIAILPILATATAYFIFLFRDPDRLQSEEFVLRQHAQQVTLTKGRAPENAGNEPPLLNIETKMQEDDR